MENNDLKKPFIVLNGVHKAFGNLEVLKGVNLEIGEGEVVVLIGRSGSGKSTLLNCVALLEQIAKGTIEVDVALGLNTAAFLSEF